MNKFGKLHIQFATAIDGSATIRKWSLFPFEGGSAYLLSSSLPQQGEEGGRPAPETHLRALLGLALEVLDGYADPTGYVDRDGEPLPADAENHEGVLARETAREIRAALATEGSADA